MNRRVAILIGNQNFLENSGFTSLNGPLNDIDILGKTLSSKDKGNFEVLSLADADSNDIKTLVEKTLNYCGIGDLVLIHYAGHGKLDRSGNLYLAASNTNSSSPLSTSVLIRDLREYVTNSDCESVILLLDCCYSGAATRTSRGDLNTQLKLLEDASGLFVLSASSDFQVANELISKYDGKVMGLFTSTIIDGITSAEADLNKDGNIHLTELVRYVKSKMRTQTPQWFASNASGDPLISYTEQEKDPTSSGLSNFVSKNLIYDNERSDNTFTSWIEYCPAQFPGSPRSIAKKYDGRHLCELRSHYGEIVGVNKLFKIKKGSIILEYKSKCELSNICIFLIPINPRNYRERPTKRELIPHNDLTVSQNIPLDRIRHDLASDTKDQWVKLKIDFDFSASSSNVSFFLAPRINEGVPKNCPGYLSVSKIKLFEYSDD